VKTMTISSVLSANAVSASSDRGFFTGLSIIIALVVLAGFGPSYYFRGFTGQAPELTGLMHLHGLAFSLWIMLLVTQTCLIAAHRRDLHRQLGLAGVGAGLFLIAMAASLAYERTLTWLKDPGFSAYDVLQFLAIPVTTILYFSGMFTAALILRNRSAVHKRLMMLATFDIITPAISRLPWMTLQSSTWHYVATDLLLLALLLHDLRTLRRPHTATVIGGAVLIASQLGREWLALTDTWLDIALWLTA